MYKQTINDHLTALGNVEDMFIVVEYNNPTYPDDPSSYNIAHGADLRLSSGMHFLHDVGEGTQILSYDNLKDAQKMCSRLNYGYESTKRLIETGSLGI